MWHKPRLFDKRKRQGSGGHNRLQWSLFEVQDSGATWAQLRPVEKDPVTGARMSVRVGDIRDGNKQGNDTVLLGERWIYLAGKVRWEIDPRGDEIRDQRRGRKRH